MNLIMNLQPEMYSHTADLHTLQPRGIQYIRHVCVHTLVCFCFGGSDATIFVNCVQRRKLEEHAIFFSE